MKFVYIFCLFMTLWAFLAQGCMSFRISDDMAKQQFKNKGVDLTVNAFTIDDRRIHFASSGSDDLPTLLFIHGTPGSWNAFMDYMQDQQLLQKFRVVSVDRPGFGYSDFGKPMNLPAQSSILNKWVEKIQNGKPVYLIGHSLGGPLIVKMAADNPKLYNGLVIISGSIDPDEEKAEKWRVALFKTPLNYFVPGAFRPSNEELWYLKKDLRDMKEDYGKIKMPVYFIHGDNDTWVPPGNVAFGKKMLVNSGQISELMLPRGNHFIPWTHYKEIRDVLLTLHP